MTARQAFSAIASIVLIAIPSLAPAAVVQKWQTASGVDYSVISRAGDFNGDGVYKLITEEVPSGGSERIGIRSAATGALLAQSAASYPVNGVWLQDTNADGTPEIFVWDATGRLNCLDYVTGNSALVVRWTYGVPTQFTWTFVDFDGNGQLYLAIKDVSSNSYLVLNHSGILAASFTIPTAPSGTGWSTILYSGDYDNDGRSELLIDYHYNNGSIADALYMYENNSPTAVGPGTTGVGALALGRSFPNPTFRLSRVEYTLPTAGPASLRLFDVTGREVRTLVQGQLPAGPQEATWDGLDGEGRPVPAGAYFYELKAGGQRQTRQIVRLQ